MATRSPRTPKTHERPHRWGAITALFCRVVAIVNSLSYQGLPGCRAKSNQTRSLVDWSEIKDVRVRKFSHSGIYIFIINGIYVYVLIRVLFLDGTYPAVARQWTAVSAGPDQCGDLARLFEWSVSRPDVATQITRLSRPQHSPSSDVVTRSHHSSEPDRLKIFVNWFVWGYLRRYWSINHGA